MAVWRIAASRLAELGRSYSGVLRNFVSKVVSCCDEVCSRASFDCSSFDSMSRHLEDVDFAS